MIIVIEIVNSFFNSYLHFRKLKLNKSKAM